MPFPRMREFIVPLPQSPKNTPSFRFCGDGAASLRGFLAVAHILCVTLFRHKPYGDWRHRSEGCI